MHIDIQSIFFEIYELFIAQEICLLGQCFDIWYFQFEVQHIDIGSNPLLSNLYFVYDYSSQ